MELNETELEVNETLIQVINYFNISITNLTNSSQETQIKLFDLYEAYKTREKEQLLMYSFIAYIVGTLIILSNLTVVISSGLILKKGQQPKSTYLLLGNVSLADTIIGVSIIFGTNVDKSTNSSPMCIFQIGMLVCPAMVSIFSVGLIAVDRYIYILHGLYYQRWFNTTKVRIGIVCIWMIGITLGFIPVTGWKNTGRAYMRCHYVGLFPESIVYLNAVLSLIPIIVVAILYSIILVKALKNVAKIKATGDLKNSASEPQLRMYKRGNAMKHPDKNKETNIRRSASFDSKYQQNAPQDLNKTKSKSINIASINKDDKTIGSVSHNPRPLNKTQYDSKCSVCTIETLCSDTNVSSSTTNVSSVSPCQCPKILVKKMMRCKNEPRKGPNKWRAVTVVMLTSGSFIVTWLPFFIVLLFYVSCEEKLTNPKCINYGVLAGPFSALAFLNSILNPIIYAWWHKGFKRSVRLGFRKYCLKYFKKKNSNTC